MRFRIFCVVDFLRRHRKFPFDRHRFLGIHNVVALRGDGETETYFKPENGHVFKDLVEQIVKMNHGNLSRRKFR